MGVRDQLGQVARQREGRGCPGQLQAVLDCFLKPTTPHPDDKLLLIAVHSTFNVSLLIKSTKKYFILSNYLKALFNARMSTTDEQQQLDQADADYTAKKASYDNLPTFKRDMKERYDQVKRAEIKVNKF